MSTAEPDSADNAGPDFMLDPSDPLYMLLNNTHDGGASGFSMDLDFNDPSFPVFVDPNALFLDRKAQVPFQPQDLLNPSFPFSFSSPTLSSASASPDDSPSGFTPSSPDSSSSARASPGAPPVSRSTAGASDCVVRHNWMLMHGLDTVPAFFSQVNGPFVVPFQSHLAVQQPIPPTPTPSPPVHTAQGPQTHAINTATTGRPKTSHTTIERRYRTNLNARIQSLKAAVPALRVLDQNFKNDEYKVDDRGYIDGVKVARKGSKANVLGKAVEYIR